MSFLGLDSVSASRVAQVLHSIAHDPVSPIPVITSIHQPRSVHLLTSITVLLISMAYTCSSQLYQSFDTILLLSHGRTLYSGPGLFAPSDYFATAAPGVVPAYPQGYNVADYLLEVASDPHVSLFQLQQNRGSEHGPSDLSEKGNSSEVARKEDRSDLSLVNPKRVWLASGKQSKYATTFLTQLQFLSGREWKILRRLAFHSQFFNFILTLMVETRRYFLLM